VRLEDREQARAPSFEEARPAVVEALAKERAPQAQQAVREQVLASIRAEIYDGALARLAAGR